MIQDICTFILQTTAVYFLSISLIYALLLYYSWKKIKSHLSQDVAVTSLPSVSFIVPAYNEEDLIVETIQTYLSLPQSKKEVIVINDGSHDSTFKLLQNMFLLRKGQGELYQSILYPELKVITAPHMGKARALNLGVSFAAYDLICTMDADTIPTARGVEACLRAFARDENLVAAGGVIQILSTGLLKENSPVNGRSNKWLPNFQRVEYLRTFICERLGWSFIGSTLLISGAFCMLKKSALTRAGGFSHRSITEDFDLIVRLRKVYRGEAANFEILPVTTCYTQGPFKLKHLMRQRMRWQMGLIQTLSQHLSLFMNPAHGPLGTFAIPYFWMVEVWSPIFEGLAFIAVPLALYHGWLSVGTVALFLAMGLAFNLILTLIGVHFDNHYVSKEKNWSYGHALWITLILQLGYKQMNSWWRFIALIKSMGRNHSWGEKSREEIIHLT
jgi:cellulose synthase/poly-beta-1,6-N-acetylglucosamine synthase-like glycosyltransferase